MIFAAISMADFQLQCLITGDQENWGKKWGYNAAYRWIASPLQRCHR